MYSVSALLKFYFKLHCDAHYCSAEVLVLMLFLSPHEIL
jgi:hypothetical protein